MRPARLPRPELDPEIDHPRSRLTASATLEMVAAESGVSRSTVSRVVNGSPKVRPEVVQAVSAAIERLNYVPNRAARSLASRQTYAIALLVPERVKTFFNDPFFASVVQGITTGMEDSDYILNLLVSSSDPTRKTRRYLRGGNVDGALVVSHHTADTDLADLCDIMPVVFGGRPALADLASCHFVDIDNVQGARTAVDHLVSTGRRRIATITGPADMRAGVDRRTGWAEGLAVAGLPAEAVAVGDFTEAGGAAATRTLLDVASWYRRSVRGQRPDGPRRRTDPAGVGPYGAGRRGGDRLRRLACGHGAAARAHHDRSAVGADGPPDGRVAAGSVARRGRGAAGAAPDHSCPPRDRLNSCCRSPHAC